MTRCEEVLRGERTTPTSGGGCEGKAKGGRGGRGNEDPELRKPLEEEEGCGLDTAAGTGAHTAADTARGSQGGAGDLEAPGKSGSGGAERLERLRALSHFRAGAAGVRGKDGIERRARDGMSGQPRTLKALLSRSDARAVKGGGCGMAAAGIQASVRARRTRIPTSVGVLRGRVSM